MSEIEKLVRILTVKNKTISVMESCTGGGLTNDITNVAGASNVIKYSAVTYSDEYKIKMGVAKEVIDKYGVYSNKVANSMAKAISNFTGSDYGIGITGKIDSMAYVCIYIKEQDKYLGYCLELEETERVENKDKIISLVVNKLLEII